MKKIDLELLTNEIKNGNRYALSRAITLAESTKLEDLEKAQTIIQNFLPATNTKRIAITGIPGVGKSTFIETFGLFLTKLNKKVAVLAIDPSSSISKGSILGDKTRMEELAKNDLAFIRPSASNGSLGGITSRTYETILLCEAAGYEYILIETVGVGQSETLVNKITDLFLFLQLPGAGDDLQGIKRGIMEMSDILFVNKADAFNEKQIKDCKSSLTQSTHFLPEKISQWKRKTIIGSALKNEGFKELWESINQYFDYIQSNNFYRNNREKQIEEQSKTYILEIIERKTTELIKTNKISIINNNAFESAIHWLQKNKRD